MEWDDDYLYMFLIHIIYKVTVMRSLERVANKRISMVDGSVVDDL